MLAPRELGSLPLLFAFGCPELRTAFYIVFLDLCFSVILQGIAGLIDYPNRGSFYLFC